MAYGFQYIPDAEADPRPAARVEPTHAATQVAVTTRVFRVAPAASAITAAIEALYRDIDELRRSSAEGTPAADRTALEAAGA